MPEGHLATALGLKPDAAVQGFREQTQHWPTQPVDLAIAWLKKKSPAWVAADFGCGDAQLAAAVPQTVHSFDLVAAAPGVTACNMANIPLGEAPPWKLQTAMCLLSFWQLA